jgi:hypothetical protein
VCVMVAASQVFPGWRGTQAKGYRHYSKLDAAGDSLQA